METFGSLVKQMREEKKLPLRTVAAYLDIDQAILSKIERGHRKPTRAQVVKLAEYFQAKEEDFLVAWLSDKLVCQLEDEDIALKAMQVAEEKLQYMARPKVNKVGIIESIKAALKHDGRVNTAWLFGSVARGDEKANSDIDIMVELNNHKKYSMFDLLDISFILEGAINRKVDLVEKGYLQGFAMKAAQSEMIKIYG